MKLRTVEVETKRLPRGAKPSKQYQSKNEDEPPEGENPRYSLLKGVKAKKLERQTETVAGVGYQKGA